jgi:hypothetical protein
MPARSSYSSSRRIQDLRVGEDLIPDDPVQALLRDEVNTPTEELFQILLQSEIRHAQVIAGNPLCQTPVRHEDEVNLCGQ